MGILLCIVINMMDGFDVLVIAFTAPSISAEWDLSGAALGWLLSSGLLGMAIGSLLLGPIADRAGRRRLIQICLLIIGFGMLFSAWSADVRQLTVFRLVTGLGIGGILPVLNTIVAEYSNERWRSFWVSFLQTGYPIGATLGGLMTVALIAGYGWRSAFLLGAGAAFLMFLLALKWLPESMDFLVSNQPAGALERINKMLRKLGKTEMDHLPERAGSNGSYRTGYGELLSNPVLRRRALLLCLSFFAMMYTFYFVMSWTPKILVDSGMSTTQGISGGILLNTGGIIGSLLLGYLSSVFSLARLVQVYVVLTGLLMVVFVLSSGNIAGMVVVAVSLGFFMFGSMVGLYALSPHLYPTESRAAGISIAIGVGRVGAVIAPLIAGVLFDMGMPKLHGYYWFALPLIIIVVSLILLSRNLREKG